MPSSLWLALVLITTGLLLVPLSGMALVLHAHTRPFNVAPDVAGHLRAILLWFLLALAVVQGAGWLIRLKDVGYAAVGGWGWVIAVVAAGLLLPPTSIAAVTLRNRPGQARRVAFSAVVLLATIQLPYWILMGMWAVLYAVADLSA
jgi:hypothetical protein